MHFIKNLILFLFFAANVSHQILYANLHLPGKGKKIVVFTDYEADDSVAIGLFLKYLKDHKVHESDDFMIGTLLSNQYRKKALAQELVRLFGYEADIVCAGSGGIKEPFEQEGRNILSPDQLAEFLILDQKYLQPNDPMEHANEESRTHFLTMLADAEPNSIDVLLLTNPIDFMNAIRSDLDLFSKIRDIYMMGGWFENRPTFNWNLHIESVIDLLALLEQAKGSAHSPNLYIFSSHFFAREFNGYVNQSKFPEVIAAFDSNRHPIVQHLRAMVKNWDDSMTVVQEHHSESERKWRLEMVERIGKENIGRQFAPADPATMIGYLYPDEFILTKTPCSLQLVTAIDQSGKTRLTVDCIEDAQSNVFVIQKVDLGFFNRQLVELMHLNQ